MAKNEPAAKAKGGISILGVLIISVLAAGAGIGVGTIVPAALKPVVEAKKEEKSEHGAALPAAAVLTPLGPVTTNLAKPATTWIRLESMLVVEKDLGLGAEAMKKKMSEDILGYLRTISLDQLAGPSGFQHLREDLNDRVRVRSDGKVSGLVITSMILE